MTHSGPGADMLKIDFQIERRVGLRAVALCVLFCATGMVLEAAADVTGAHVESTEASQQARDIVRAVNSRMSKVHLPLEIVADKVIRGILQWRYRGKIHDATAAMDRVLQEILVSNRLERLYPWKIHFVNDPAVNFLATPHGNIYVFDGILNLGLSEEQFAGILVHEISHTVQKHTVKRLEFAWGATAATVLSSLLLQHHFGAPGTAAQLAYVPEFLMLLKRSRDEESSADALGVELLRATSFGCEALTHALERLGAPERSTPDGILKYFQTHPHTSERIQRTRQLCAMVAP